MRIIGHGIDMVDCRRIEQLIERHGDRFLNRVFTAAEQDYSKKNRRRMEHLGGRFAVKEAIMKVLGTGWRNGIAWTDIETKNDSLGKPTVQLTGKIATIAEQIGVKDISISITHTKELAIASAIAMGQDE